MPGLQRPTDAGDSVGSPMDCDGAVKTLLVLLLVFQMGPNHFLYLGFLYFYNIFLVKVFKNLLAIKCLKTWNLYGKYSKTKNDLMQIIYKG